jgi:hypothetical protein
MASHLNPPNRQSHVYNFNQLIRDIRHACLTRLLCMKVEIYQLPTLPTSLLRTSFPTSGGPLAPSGSFFLHHIPYHALICPKPLNSPHQCPSFTNHPIPLPNSSTSTPSTPIPNIYAFNPVLSKKESYTEPTLVYP